MKKIHIGLSIKIAFLFIGTVIGAGFASGKELIVFFGTTRSEFLPKVIIVVVFFFCSAFLFLNLGRKVKSVEVSFLNKAIFKKLYIIVDVFFLLCFFVVSISMTAGAQSLFNQVLNVKFIIPFFSVFTILLALVIVKKGMGGLMNLNAILVPVILLYIVVISILSISNAVPCVDFVETKGIGNKFSGVLYSSMNMLTTLNILICAGKDITKKDAIIGSMLGSVITGGVIFLFLNAIISGGNAVILADMPIVTMSRAFSKMLPPICGVMIWCAIFTTLVSSVYPIYVYLKAMFEKNGKTDDWIVYFIIGGVTVILSLFGFSFVVQYFYPIMGVIGVIFTFIYMIYYLKTYSCCFKIKRCLTKKKSVVKRE